MNKSDLHLFDYQFKVKAPLQIVSYFHRDPQVLKKLMPIAQIHYFEPLQDGSKAKFTLWVGPIGIRWQARHDQVSLNGFRDTQVEGPFARWQHRHQFTAVSQQETLIQEHIEYAHKPGFRGQLTRLLFNRVTLWLVFNGRKWLTRYHLRRLMTAK